MMELAFVSAIDQIRPNHTTIANHKLLTSSIQQKRMRGWACAHITSDRLISAPVASPFGMQNPRYGMRAFARAKQFTGCR